MARSGLLPVVHSFSCFLSARPNEQIFNNATEGTKIVYVGGLSGVLPAGPGHSHQSLREISASVAIPGLVMVEPCCPEEVGPLLDWCLNVHGGSSYLRLISIPYAAGYAPRTPKTLAKGQGWTVRDGKDAVILTAGLVMLGEACKAAEALAKDGVSVRVVNMPWLNDVDGAWLAKAVGDVRAVLTVDNHYARFGQGDVILSALARSRRRRARREAGLGRRPPVRRERGGAGRGGARRGAYRGEAQGAVAVAARPSRPCRAPAGRSTTSRGPRGFRSGDNPAARAPLRSRRRASGPPG